MCVYVCVWQQGEVYEGGGLSLHSVTLPCGVRIPSTTQGAPVSEPRHQTHPEF